MPRLREVRRAEVTDSFVEAMYQQLFDDRDPVEQPGTATGSPGDWWTVYALVPDVLKHAVRGFSLYASPDRALDPLLRELGQTRAGWATGSQFVFSQHCKSCRALGMPEEKIAAIPAWSAAACFDETERLVLTLTDALVFDRGRVADGVVERLVAAIGDEAVLECTYITAMYVMHAIVCRALRLEFDDRDEPTVEVAAPADYVARDLASDIAGPR
jgi:alkylhydroperoxidase family enzyme